MSHLPIYLDYAAATPIDEAVLELMLKILRQDGLFGNPSAKDHIYGWQAAEVVEEAREKIAKVVGCSPLALTYTSGASESNNLAILGLARSKNIINSNKRHIISSQIEHKSVLSALEYLQEQGFKVTLLKPTSQGEITAQMVAEAIDDQTFLVSICHANSVVGTVNDIFAIADVCRANDVYFHTDCAQSAGWFDLNLDKSNISLASLTPEKIYGPKGVGALYIKKELNLALTPLIFGGGQERNLRGGTVATHQVAAMGEAFYQMEQKANADKERLYNYRKQIIQALSELDFVKINGKQDSCLPTIVSVSFKDIDPLMLLPSLHELALSTGSACSSSNLQPSYVLKAIGLSDKEARASIRISIGRFTTQEQITKAIEHIKSTVIKLHQACDMWQVKE